MRLLSLDLERYGPFSGHRLRFREDARLHVVLGPNEAGKSSALSAVTDLLFGIEGRTAYAFLHAMPELRIGAEIASSDGRRLAFRRRKGNRNTLIDAADAALPDDALAPFLGGLTRQVFCHAFGLGSEELRKGGREMMDSEGEVGASLAAAASGLRGYAALQKSLEEESEKIFAPRASQNRSFYQALARREEARKAVRAGELRAGDWRALNDEIAGAGARLETLKASREARAAERAGLERLKRVGPLLADIDALVARAEADAGLAVLPETVPESWADTLGRHVATLRETTQAQTRTGAALAEAVAGFEAVPVDERLAAEKDRILEAFGGIGEFEKEGIDLPRVAGEAEALARDLDGIAMRIGIAPDAMRERQPSDADKAAIDGLIRRGRALSTAQGRLAQELDRGRREQAGSAEAQGDAPAEDPAPLRSALKTFGNLRQDIAQRDAVEAAIDRAARPLPAQAARLSPPVADLAALALRPLATQDAIARARQHTEALDRACETAREAVARAGTAVAGTRERLRLREAGRPIPTAAELAALRAERDREIAALASALLSGQPAQAESPARIAAAVAAADRAADALVADADRAAAQAADRLKLETDEAAAQAAAAHRAEVEAEREAAVRAWQALWEPAGLVPGPPADMATWRGEVDGLLERHEAVAGQRIEAARLSARIEACRAPLLDLSRRAGLADLDGLGVGLIHDRAEARIASLSEAWQAARESQAGARATAGQIARIEAEIAQAKQDDEAWRAAWTGAIGAIGLRPEATPDEAAACLAAWGEVPGALREHANRRSRVDGMNRNRTTYAAMAGGLVAELAPDLAALPPGPAIKALHGRLQAALAGATRREELGRLRALAASQDAAAREAAERTAQDLAAQLAVAGPDAARFDPSDLLARLLARRAARADLSARRLELARAADGQDEAGMRARLTAVPIDEVETLLARLDIAEEEDAERGRIAFAERDRCERRRQDLEAGMGAELAQAQRRAAEAEIQAAAQDWAVLKVASLMLGSAIGRHRAGQQDPLVARAGALFSGLTGGAFAGLVQYYNDDDLPCIGGNRGSGKPVPVEGLSEGTRDQLYLALRLAYLEDYATRSEPAPFIGDDLFLTFDDARTGHGIEALASLGGAIQPILFTHHRHVAEIAQARLGARVEVLAL